MGHLDHDAHAHALANPVSRTRHLLLVGLITAIISPIASCVPVPPVPDVAVTARVLHFPLIQVNDYTWQATGYGRPYTSIGKDPELHNRGMWSYSWGVGNCLDIPMVFSDQQIPDAPGFARCAETSPVLLVFNEPEYASQANMTPEVAAKALRYLESAWPGELWCCGNLVSHAGWLDRMLTAYKAEFGGLPRLAGFHVHVYVNDGRVVDAPADPSLLARSQVEFARYDATVKRWGLPARYVVTECCALHGADLVPAMDAYMTWLRSVPGVESVAWFSARYAGFPDANLLRAGGRLTVVGEEWLDWRWK
jgi:hypothetical protein